MIIGPSSCFGFTIEEVVAKPPFPITKVRAFGGVTENVKGEALGFPPWLLLGTLAMNQFWLIAICLGLASSALGTCTSSIPSR